jgi:hypothetical protein
MGHDRRTVAAFLAAAGALAMPGQAAGAEVRVTVPCVFTSAQQPPSVPIEGTGFTPSSTASIFTNGYQASIEPVPLAADGSLRHDLQTPIGSFSHKTPAELKVVDEAGVTATTTFLMVYRSLLLPRVAIAGRAVTHQAVGYPVGKTVRLFYEHGGRVRFSRVLGPTAAPCGATAGRKMAVLRRSHRDGVWRIGVTTGTSPRRVDDVYRVRKRGGRITNLGEE